LHPPARRKFSGQLRSERSLRPQRGRHGSLVATLRAEAALGLLPFRKTRVALAAPRRAMLVQLAQGCVRGDVRAARLRAAPLIGADVRVAAARDVASAGATGVVLWESKSHVHILIDKIAPTFRREGTLPDGTSASDRLVRGGEGAAHSAGGYHKSASIVSVDRERSILHVLLPPESAALYTCQHVELKGDLFEPK
jgi:Ribonuclease P/MRP, subunit p29